MSDKVIVPQMDEVLKRLESLEEQVDTLEGRVDCVEGDAREAACDADDAVKDIQRLEKSITGPADLSFEVARLQDEVRYLTVRLDRMSRGAA